MMPAMGNILCSGADAGLTVLECLSRRIPAAPTAYLRQLLQKQKILRAGTPLGERDNVRDGDVLCLPASQRLQEILATTTRELTILFESREMLVVAKPAGLAVHTGLGHAEDNLTDRLQQMMRLRKEPFRVSPAHRLDAATSGPVLFGKGRNACAALGKMFMAGAVEKIYLALAAGHLPETGQLVSPVPAKGKWKSSLTEYRCLEFRGNHSLLQLRLLSGRTHQIRRQLADAGHPLAGDRRYRGPDLPGLDRLFLHGSRLALTNPFDGTRLEIDCPLPAELEAVLTNLPPSEAKRII
jgi:RluA family pseudouridine synthase